METRVLKYAEINSSKAIRNGEVVVDNPSQLIAKEYFKEIYMALDLKYPKFYKMDGLCQLALLATEMLIGDGDYKGDEIAIILGNKNASLSSDKQHYAAIASKENYFPSPAVFVYTLPNIMLGEICIKHKITGENSCFMMENIDADFLHTYVSHLFEADNYKYCITGFVDFTEENYIAKLFLAGSVDSSDSEATYKFDKTFNKIIP
ncbi:beta-ketoacyl-[acyl-carrier-protein] synthase family protein [Fulvivirga sediminis]|uniref:3-oxoacyl-ACP synthase n=1 Tax=Fulvivirga sediminis TaxID=2803949 RepID=A0A937FAC1_9BACT|nr:hypothetical protein [Fulvivirga sediminis]MBL3656838.1 hypothetical protein [Fulvivirga sediminis]